MSSGKKTVFNKLWLDPTHFPEFGWLEEIAGNSGQAGCKVCKTVFTLSNMGRTAVTSHANSAKHLKSVSAVQPRIQGTLVSSAECVLASFKEALTELPLSKLMQVSMDGPAVNWKFVELLSKDLADDHVQLLEMGSCGLHVIHDAFQTGHKASGWNVNGYLRAMYGLFKDSPARRAACDWQQNFSK